MTVQTTTPIRILRETRRQLRHIAAETDETIQAIIARLVAAEYAKYDQSGQIDSQIDSQREEGAAK